MEIMERSFILLTKEQNVQLISEGYTFSNNRLLFKDHVLLLPFIILKIFFIAFHDIKNYIFYKFPTFPFSILNKK